MGELWINTEGAVAATVRLWLDHPVAALVWILILAVALAGAIEMSTRSALQSLRFTYQVWRTEKRARRLGAARCVDRTSRLMDLAADEAFAALTADPVGAGPAAPWRGKTPVSPDLYKDDDWLALIAHGDAAPLAMLALGARAAHGRLGDEAPGRAIEAAAANARADVAADAAPDAPPAPDYLLVLSALELIQPHAPWTNAPESVARLEAATTYLHDKGCAKAALALLGRGALAQAAQGGSIAHGDLAARFHALSVELRCSPAQAISALLLARRALNAEDIYRARQLVADLVAIEDTCTTRLQVAIADVQAELCQRVGHFQRARGHLERRAALERELATAAPAKGAGRSRAAAAKVSRARQLRVVRAHLLADLARVELVEAVRTSGAPARETGRHAEAMLRESMDTFLAGREAVSLSLAYTRLAMAAVLQRHLLRARRCALKARRLAELTRSAELVSAAEDLIKRIDSRRRLYGLPRFSVLMNLY